MMHTATEGLKFKRLVRRIRGLVDCASVSAETITVGLLERLWHAAAREARDGRIGAKFDRDDIAELVGWLGDSQALLDVLVAERWLDLVHGVLVVHDWDDHKPNWLRGVEGRRGAVRGEFSENLSQNELGAVPSQQLGSEPSSRLGEQTSHLLGNQPSTVLPNLTKPNPTVPNQTQPNTTKQNQIAAAASLPPVAAAKFDFSRLEDTPDQRELARLAAERLHKAAGKVLTREFIWSVAWISEAAVRGFCTEMHDKIRAGGVNNFRRYIERALDGELAKFGVSYVQCVEFVPAIGKREAQTA